MSATRNNTFRILSIAWPILISQLALVSYGVADTIMASHYSATDLAALALGASIYVSIFLGLSGILQALTPRIAQLFGAQNFAAIGAEARQGLWLAIFLSIIGSSILAFPQFLLDLAHASPQLQGKAGLYLRTLAWALPASLCFAVYSAFNNALAKPKMVMLLQVTGLLLKIILNAWFIYGGFGLSAMGGPGCALATAIVTWSMLLGGYFLLKRSTQYAAFQLFTGWVKPHWPSLKAQLKLGIPLGFAFFIEVTSFALMAIFIARLGDSMLAAHQIAANIGAVMYMLPLSIASATSTLVAQALGASDLAQARRVSWHGIRLATFGAASLGILVWLMKAPILQLYTSDANVVSRALPLFAFLACYQFFDALQSTVSFVLRAHHIAVFPMVANAFALWGIGLFGGCVLGLDLFNLHPPAAISGAIGFWLSNSASLVALAIILLTYLVRLQRRLAANNLPLK